MELIRAVMDWLCGSSRKLSPPRKIGRHWPRLPWCKVWQPNSRLEFVLAYRDDGTWTVLPQC
eukprot:4874612-Karenia_brevis.AAC.1